MGRLESGAHPALARVLACAVPLCTVHPVQLNWVRQEQGCAVAYVDLDEDRHDLTEQPA